MEKQPFNVLLVEDNDAHAEMVGRGFQRHCQEFQLIVVKNLKEADGYLKHSTPDVIVADLILPDGKGTQLLPPASQKASYPVVVMTSHGDESAAVEVMKRGALDYIVKSEITLFDIPHIVRRTLREWKHIIERRRAEQKLARQAEVNQAIAELSKALIVPTVMRDIAALVVEAARRLTGSTLGFVSHIDPQTGDPLCADSPMAFCDFCQAADQDGSIRQCHGFRSWTLPIGQPALINSVVETLPCSGLPEAFLPIRRYLSATARINEAVVGQLVVANADHDYAPLELDLIDQLASIYAMAVQRRKMEEALSEEKERLAVTLRSIGDGVITTNVDGEIELINRVAERLTGWSQQEAIGKPLTEVFRLINEVSRKPCANLVETILNARQTVVLPNNTVLMSRDGKEYAIAESGAPMFDQEGRIHGVVLVFRDITIRRKMEGELLKAQKLESLGIFAGGIAHDFNNFLAAIIGNISLAKMYAPKEGRVLRKLEDMEKASLRAKNLTQQLLTFAKGGEPFKIVVSIGELVKDSAQFALRGSHVRCEFSIAQELWPVEVDEGQMSQVINNLVLNAVQAMPEGGIIKVAIDNEVLAGDRPVTAEPGRYVKISVADHGIGIPREHLSRIFDPYFTTKQQGSGIGLAVAYSVIKKHGGKIMVDTEMGKGTTFTIYLPVSDKMAVKNTALECFFEPGRGRILVMDDEPYIRELVGDMLRHIGYEVSSAADGSEAIEIYQSAKESEAPFDAVIMDLTVAGGMGGREAVKRLLAIDPNARVIVSSGYSNDPIMANFSDYGFQGVISKPYTMQELSKVLRGVVG